MNKKKKVAYILTPIEFGGAEKVSLNLIKNINRDKFIIYPIVLIRPWENKTLFIEHLENENYQYLTIPVAIKPASEGKDYLRVFRCFKLLFSILKKEHFDIVHTNGYFADIIGIPASKLLRIQHIATCHGYIANDNTLKVYNKLDQFLLKSINIIIAVSDKLKKELHSFGIKEQKIVVIQNAVEQSINPETERQLKQNFRQSYNLQKNEILLGYVGRLSKEKGLEYLIEAMSLLLDSKLKFKLMIIGDGPQRQEIEYLVQAKGIQNNVIFTGFQNKIEEIIPVLDIFILPSLTEGTPMSLLESMAFGLPVVATAVGGIPVIINSGDNGILISPSKPEEIVNAVLSICNNSKFREKLSKGARETIRNRFGIFPWLEKIESLYCELTKTKILLEEK